MKMEKVLFLALVLAGSFVAVASANAQTFDRGEIHGFVYDTSQSIVPKARVAISNPSTGYKRELQTDQTGFYAFPQLLPGVYKILAQAEGFAAAEITDINVAIGASLELDVTLPVKGQSTTVTVSAAAGPVDTTTAGINQVINQKNVENLPLAGRDYRDLAQLSSSAEVVPGLRGGIRLGGQQSDYSGLVIDGQDNFDNFFGENFGSLETKNFTVPLDSVQEFQVVTNGFAPEFGRATGGLINVITKSGTNNLHGTAHYNARTRQFTADDALGTPSNIDLQQQFGGTVGFPIHKDRQFLFLATDIQRQHGPLTTICTTPGCEAALAATTGPVFAAGCVPSTAPCAAGQVPLPANAPAGFFLAPSCKSPSAGDSVLKDCYGVTSLAGFLGASNQFQNLFTLIGKYDWQMTPANHFSIRGNGTRNHTSGFTGGLGQNEINAAFNASEIFVNQGISGVFSLNTVLGRKVNEIRVSIQGETRKRQANGAGQPTVLLADSGFTFGERYYLPINGDDGKLEGQDNFEYIFGKHDVKFGGDINTFAVRKNMFAGWSTGQFEYGSLTDFQNGNAFGLIENFSANGRPLFQAGTTSPSYQSDLGLYLQDKWALTPRITLTYGLRWDGTWNPQPQTPLPGNQVLAGVGSSTHAIPVPQRIPNDFGQWGPRVGVAWNAIGGAHATVVRGAWGYYYAQTVVLFIPVGGGGRTSALFCFPPFTPGCSIGPGMPYIYNTQVPPPGAGGLPNFTYFDPSTRNPRVSNLTGSVEHSFAHNWTVSATYAFVHSTRLRTGGYGTEEQWARNFRRCTGTGGQPPATDAFGRSILCGALDPTLSAGMTTFGSFAHGNYHSVVVNVNKRFSNHFQVFANYIWSQNKDNASSERDTDTYFGQQDPFNINIDYGRNGLDVTHQFKAAGVYDLPWGFTVSSTVIAHSGVPFPLYIDTDINGDAAANSGFSHNNDRPTLSVGGKTVLVGRYPFNQPDYFEWDGRLQKDVAYHERYHVLLQADFFNVTNRGNLYSNPDTNATISLAAQGSTCTGWSTLFPGSGALGSSCTPITSLPTINRNSKTAFGGVTQIAPLSTPFAFQVGAKLVF